MLTASDSEQMFDVEDSPEGMFSTTPYEHMQYGSP